MTYTHPPMCSSWCHVPPVRVLLPPHHPPPPPHTHTHTPCLVKYVHTCHHKALVHKHTFSFTEKFSYTRTLLRSEILTLSGSILGTTLSSFIKTSITCDW